LSRSLLVAWPNAFNAVCQVASAALSEVTKAAGTGWAVAAFQLANWLERVW